MIAAAIPGAAASRRRNATWRFVRKNPAVVFGLAFLLAMSLAAASASWIAPYNPTAINPIDRLQPPSAEHLFGTDAYGRDVFSRTLHGGRISLVVGLVVALLTTVIGLAIGLLSGYVRAIDAVVMRVMDGVMAIPGVLLAIAIMALTRGSVLTVIIAIAIPEIPRMVRVVRSVVFTIREQPYMEAAIATGTRFHVILWRHVLPNALAPVIVQATFVFASAVILEAYLSFLGAGTPPENASWGNIMAEARSLVHFAIWVILFPGCFLGVMVLSINMLGDGLRDLFDPRASRRR